MNSARTRRVDTKCVFCSCSKWRRAVLKWLSKQPDVMKTNLRVVLLVVGLVSLVLCVGREEEKANAEDVPTFTDVTPTAANPATDPKPVTPIEAPAGENVDKAAAPATVGTNRIQT